MHNSPSPSSSAGCAGIAVVAAALYLLACLFVGGLLFTGARS